MENSAPNTTSKHLFQIALILKGDQWNCDFIKDVLSKYKVIFKDTCHLIVATGSYFESLVLRTRTSMNGIIHQEMDMPHN